MSTMWSDIDFTKANYEDFEHYIELLSNERNDVKFNHYYVKMKSEIYHSKILKENTKTELEDYLVAINESRYSTSNYGIEVLFPVTRFLNNYDGKSKDLNMLLIDVGVEDILRARSACAKFYNLFSNTNIAMITLNYGKSILLNDIQREELHDLIPKDLANSKALVRSLVGSKIITEDLAIQMIEQLDKFVELYMK